MSLINNTVRLKAEFRDFDNALVIPDNVKLKIYDGTRNQIGEDINVEPDENGVYWYDYVVPEINGRLYFEFVGTLNNNPILGRSVIDVRWV